MQRDYKLFIADMLKAARRIEAKLQGVSLAQLAADQDLQDIVIRNLTILGEAAGSIPQEIRDRFPAVDWRGMRGQRDKIVHKYFGIDWELVLEAAQAYLPRQLPGLEAALQALANEATRS